MLKEVLDLISENPYFIGVHILAITGTIAFLFLSKEKKKEPEYYWAFIILLISSVYELISSISLVNRDLNESIHTFISDTPYKGYNIWVYNILYYQVSMVLLILWINFFIVNKKLIRINIYLTLAYIGAALLLELTKIQEITEFQPVIYFMGYVLSIIASGLFFMDLISSDKNIDINPLRFIPFWFITFNLFQNVLSILADIALDYLAFNNLQLYYFFNYISQFLYILMLISIVVIFINKGLFIEKKANTA